MTSTHVNVRLAGDPRTLVASLSPWEVQPFIINDPQKKLGGKEAFKYNASEGILRTTFMPIMRPIVSETVASQEFWFFFSVHLILRACFSFGVLGSVEGHSVFDLDWDTLGVIAAMTTYFNVDYSRLCYNRYSGFYKLTSKLFETIFGGAGTLSYVLNGDDMDGVVRLSFRYMVASLWLCASEAKYHEEDDGVMSEDEWDEMISRGILRMEEQRVLEKVHPDERSTLLLRWAAHVVYVGAKKAMLHPNPTILLGLNLCSARKLQSKLRADLNCPVPFQYFHFLNMMILINIILWAWKMAITDSWFAPIIFFFAQLIFKGMLDLASQISNPFGHDTVDFPMHTWLLEALQDANAMLDNREPAESRPTRYAQKLREEMPLVSLLPQGGPALIRSFSAGLTCVPRENGAIAVDVEIDETAQNDARSPAFTGDKIRERVNRLHSCRGDTIPYTPIGVLESS